MCHISCFLHEVNDFSPIRLTNMVFFKKAQRSLYAENATYRTQMVEYNFVTKSAEEMGEKINPQDLDHEFGQQWIESVVEQVVKNIERLHPLLLMLLPQWMEFSYQLPSCSSSNGSGDCNDEDDDRWMAVLGAWCAKHEDKVNVMVLTQEQEGTTHRVLWQSRGGAEECSLVLWYDAASRRLLRVCHPHRLYGDDLRHTLCLKCGVTYRKNRNHDCSAMVTPHSTGCKRRPHFRCTEKQRQAKRSRLENAEGENDNCLGRALYQALVIMGNELSCSESKALEDWYEEMGMQAHWNQPAGLKEVKEWSHVICEEYGDHLEVVVYDETLRKVLGRFGRRTGEQNTTPLFLNVNNHHFTWISSMPAWLGRSYFCHMCLKGYNDKERHRCTQSCPRCGDETRVHNKPRWGNIPLVCEVCQCSFWTPTCFRLHQSQRRHVGTLVYTQCERRYMCRHCKKDRLIKKRQPGLLPRSHHVCFQYDCQICGESQVIRGKHQCFVRGRGEEQKKTTKKQKKTKQKQSKAKNQDDHEHDNSTRSMKLAFFDLETRCLDEDHHQINKVVVLLVYEQCSPHLEDYATRGCTGSCGRQRMYVFDTMKGFMDWLLGPHHGRWRQYTFLAHNLKGYDAYPILEECVRRGITPDCIYQGAKVMTMTVEQGFFPHFFNTRAHAQYVGPYPAISYYGYDEMTDANERRELKTWWEGQQDQTMDFAKELTDYCIQDVLVMARGCLKFRELYVSLFNVDPFSECVTLASTCLKVFQRNFLTPHTLGVVPPMGYRPRDVYSSEALEWLHSLNCPTIQSALSPQGEAVVQGAKVDGYDPTTRTVYQYHGCFFHGCDQCYPQRHITNPYLGQTMNDAYDKTIARTQTLRRAGYKVVEKWSHDWDVEREQYPPSPRTVTRHRPLQPRQALCGGRTNAIELYAWCRGEAPDLKDNADMTLKLLTDPVHRIRYIDVVSLYPTVMKEEKYPAGHPTVLTCKDVPDSVDECVRKIQDDEWFGLIKADVDPPRALYFPVLPVIVHHRLIFGLCRTCVEQDVKDRCAHSDEERRWMDGVWTTFELRQALVQGYRLSAVHEVWHYKRRSRELFSGYIRERYFDLIYDDTITVENIVLLGNEMVQVTYTPMKESVIPLPYGNVVLASCVTAYARLRLYAMLDWLGDRVLYHDTDSVIYKTVHEGDEEVVTGSCLGQWEDECKDPSKDWLVEFVSLGPKSYAYRTHQMHTVVKCKGITFTPSVSDRLHLRSKKRLLLATGGEEKDQDEGPLPPLSSSHIP